jgi:DNA adenine methylase
MGKPFLRWAGGKRWIVPLISNIIKDRLQRDAAYIEPFLGSGAVFFGVQPRQARLSDLNEQLIATYHEVARHSAEIEAALSKLRPSRSQYYRLRKRAGDSALDRATRFIYLNRNCWGGLYRVNKDGHFNVPWGGGDRNHLGIVKDGTLRAAADLLATSSVRITCADFEEAIGSASEGDVVYCDPTYRKTTREHFDRYGATLFSWQDQKRLADAASDAANRGALVLISNVACPNIDDLYRTGAILRCIRRKGLGLHDKVHMRSETLVVLDPLQDWAPWLGKGDLSLPRRALTLVKGSLSRRCSALSTPHTCVEPAADPN